MPAIWCKAKFKGTKGEAETTSLLNSGSDLVVLPKKIADKIFPKLVGKGEVELANGSIIKRNIYEIELEVENPEKGENRKAIVKATVEKRDYPLIGILAMEELKITPDVVKGKILFL